MLLLLTSGLLVSASTLLAERQQTPPAAVAPESQGLHRLMVNAGKLYFGTAIETNNFNDRPYRAIADNPDEFGMYVPENSQKWEAIQPRQGVFSFDAADSVARLAKTNGQLFRCHTLTWHSQLPPFVQNGTWTRATLTAVLTAHITSVVTHYKSLCYAWDVVNEALAENGTLRASVFSQILGPSFLPLSFSVAGAADPSAKLYYNDFNLETTPAKAAGALRIVQQIQAAAAPIHGIGFQAHFRVGQTPNRTALVTLQNRFVALGLETSFTELDVAHLTLPANATAVARQATDYVGVVQACLDVPRCVGIVVWQFTDKYSWIPNTFPGLGDACLFDRDFKPKPAYTAVASVLAAAATGRPPPPPPQRSGGSRVGMLGGLLWPVVVAGLFVW
ncbi:glycoside hydrolase family 10 protein [Schizothecium vesticola]|uniref:Beta-xylanase n=1 Tax=Schizothecium vesticola TaxID=314040 RepID=A0AA40FBR6_9PEZI|nr:glycoside hydrolase family 10 protein [Schizothecium vesticola]